MGYKDKCCIVPIAEWLYLRMIFSSMILDGNGTFDQLVISVTTYKGNQQHCITFIQMKLVKPQRDV